MKDNYSEMNVDMEQILFSKEYDELTAAELEEIKSFISSKEDFYLMKNTLMSVKNSFGVEEEIEPRNSSKEELMKMFDQKHGKVVSIHKRPFYLNPVFQIGVAALFVLGIIFFYPKGENEKVTAMNESHEESVDDNKAAAENEESPAEENGLTETEDESETTELEVAEEKKSESQPAFLTDVPAKEDKPTIDNFLFGKNGPAKGEGADKYAEMKTASDSVLYSDINRASASKSKAKEKTISTDDDLADGTITNSSTATTVTTGATTSYDWNFASTKEEEKTESDRKKDGRSTHTNTAGGLYHQPGKPAADLKQGVSLKDQPALAEFLFTAL